MPRKTTALLLSASLTACAATPPQIDVAKLRTPKIYDIPAEINGAIWKTDGYGYILDFSDGQSAYNFTESTCLRIDPEQESPLEYIDRIRLSDDGSKVSFFSKTDPYEISAEKLDALPASCLAVPDNTPLGNFDAFENFFQTHYGFFKLYDVDWPRQTAKARAGLSQKSGEMKLVKTLIGLLSQLKDGHVSISATINGDEGEFMANPGRMMEALSEIDTGGKSPMAAFGKQYLKKDIDQTILGGQGKDILKERIKYGITSGDIGYIAIMAVGGYAASEDASFDDELAALSPGMAAAMEYFNENGVKAVIVDLSVNHGGYDFISRAIAGSFTDKRVAAYTKYAHDAHSHEPFQLFIEPSDGAKYLGPVYVMTSDMTVSGGEILTMSLRALPNVTHVGAPTRGALSDVLTKYLPNGWQITLSNEVYADHRGILWEGKGIEPDTPIAVFDLKNPLSGHAPAVDTLIKHIDLKH